MRLRRELWLLGYCFLFLACVQRGKLAVPEAALCACLLAVLLAYGLRVFLYFPRAGQAWTAALDIRRWPRKELKQFLNEIFFVCAVALIISSIAPFFV